MHIVQPLTVQHVDRGAKTAHQGRRRRVREITLIIGLRHIAEIEIAAGMQRLFAGFHRLLANPDQRHAGRHHEAFLRTCDGHVDTPFIHAELDRADRADPVHKEQRRVAQIVKNLADAGNITGDAGCGFVMACQNGLDLVMLVGLKPAAVEIQRHTLAPVEVVVENIQAEAAAHLDPQAGELAERRGQDGVCGGQAVCDRGFPAAGAGSREQEHTPFGRAEDRLHVFEQRLGEFRKVRGAMILERHVHGLSDFEWHVGRSGDRECFVADHVFLRSQQQNRV